MAPNSKRSFRDGHGDGATSDSWPRQLGARDASKYEASRFASPDGYAAEPPPPSDWKRYLATVGRHKWPVIIFTVVGTALGVLGTRFLERDYLAKSILWIERPNHSPDQDRDAIASRAQQQHHGGAGLGAGGVVERRARQRGTAPAAVRRAQAAGGRPAARESRATGGAHPRRLPSYHRPRRPCIRARQGRRDPGAEGRRRRLDRRDSRHRLGALRRHADGRSPRRVFRPGTL